MWKMSLEMTNKKVLEKTKNKKNNDLVKELVYIDKKLVQKVKYAKATKEEEAELLSKL